VIAQHVVFWILAVGMAIAAIKVVTTNNVVHAALYLVAVLAGVAAQFLLLVAEFVAWVQVLIYIGTVVVLFLFGIMLTRAPMRGDENQSNSQRIGSAVVALLLLGLLGVLIVKAFPSGQEIVLDESLLAYSETGALATTFLRDYLIPFEVLGVLLTAALIGAVTIARRD